MNRALLVAATAAAMAIGAGTVANAATVDQSTTTSVQGVGVGPASSLATAVNDRGDVTGAYNGWNSAFVWHNGVFTDLGYLSGGNYSYSTAINDDEDVVGYSGNFATNGVQGFVWHDGAMTELPGLGGSSFPKAIDNAGEIAGTASDASGNSYAVTWQHGKLTVLKGLGGDNDGAVAMDQAGQIAGYSGLEAVLWSDGKVTDLGTGQLITMNNRGEVLVEVSPASGPAYYFVYDHGTKITLPAGDDASGLNDQGQVIGSYTPAGASAQDGFVWQNGTLTDLGSGVSPVAINDRGQILADTDVNGVYGAEVLEHGRTTTLTTADGPSASAGLLSQTGFVAGTDEATASAMEWHVR